MSFDIERQQAIRQMATEEPDQHLLSNMSYSFPFFYTAPHTYLKKFIHRPLYIPVLVLATPVLVLVLATLVVVAIVLAIPVLAPLFLIILFSLPKDTTGLFGEAGKILNDKKEGGEGMTAKYEIARRKVSLWVRIGFGSVRIIARASLVVLVWLALSLFVPRLKVVTLLGSPMWKWSLFSLVLTAGYFEAAALGAFPLAFFTNETSFFYLIAAGYAHLHVIYFGVVMLSWLLYFGTHHGLMQADSTTPHPQAFHYVTWSFVSLFVGSILWLFKNLLLAKWTVDAIYRRFEPRMLITSLKYFFIGLLAAGFYEDQILENLKVVDEYGTDYAAHTTDPEAKILSVTKYIMSTKMGLLYLVNLGGILTNLAEMMNPLLDREGEEEEELVINWFQQRIKDSTDTCTPDRLVRLFHSPPGESHVTGDKYKKLANVLCGLVREECSLAPDFTFDDLKIWMVDAHKDCVNMGRTLADAKAIVTHLDIMWCIISVIVLLLWLLVTGVSSTTVLVTIATPFLAFTFIFGDTAKTFFQGLIFCFASHPFDVGDRCTLDEVELEVKRVSILTTTFSKIGSKERRLYPNSVLATKGIVNLGWQPDPKDVIELLLDSSTNLDDLKTKITEFFHEENKRYRPSYDLIVNEIGDNVKVTINFSHILTVHDLSHSQCFKKKSLQRSDFLNVIRKYITKSRIERRDTKHENQTLTGSSQYAQLTTSEITCQEE